MEPSASKKSVLIKAGLLYLAIIGGMLACLYSGLGGYTPVVLLGGAILGGYIGILPPERYASTSIPRSIIEGVVISIAVLLPYTGLLYVCQHYGILTFTPGVTAGQNIMNLILVQVVAVAIPEEYFFRGTLQPALDRIWNPRWRIFGVPYGPSLFITSILFGVAHVFTQGPIGLSTAIPALAFGLFYYRHRNIIGAVIFHAACNILADLLNVNYAQLLRFVQ